MFVTLIPLYIYTGIKSLKLLHFFQRMNRKSQIDSFLLYKACKFYRLLFCFIIIVILGTQNEYRFFFISFQRITKKIDSHVTRSINETFNRIKSRIVI